MKLSAKAQARMNEMIDRFQTGDLSPLVAVVKTKVADDAPAYRWSFSNKVLAYAQTGDLDNRTYNQWKEAGRQVKKGQSAGFIFTPRTIKKEKDDGSEYYQLIGFGTAAVFGYNQTEPIDPDSPQVVNYEPAELPPLTDVADALGIDWAFGPTYDGCLGWCSKDGKKVRVGTDDAKTWFHELAHATHATFEELVGKQTEYQEAVAEVSATVLMDLYGLGDRTGNCWNYISRMADDPLKAIMEATKTVGLVLDKITGLAGGEV